VSSLATTNTIRTVGLLLDETGFSEKESFIQELISNGFLVDNISIIVYRDLKNKKETYTRYTFDSAALNWNGTITDSTVNEFIEMEFDLLVSYYEIEKVILVLITNNSKAKFKVGFSAVDKKFNHLIISTGTENYSVFVHELFKYLKILNKIES
jgi:hypothetical protein